MKSKIHKEKMADGITIYLGDCRDILPTLEKDVVIVTDPPYGINYKHSGKSKSFITNSKSRAGRHNPNDAITGDETPFDPTLLITFSDAIIWGANHFAHKLPPSAGWYIWDKKLGLKEDSFSDCEIAWHMCGTRAMVFRRLWNGLLAHENGEKRQHTSQKPIDLMCWCIGYVPDKKLIVDPFMGSGTTGVACVRLERKFIGIEIESTHFDIACRRLHRELTEPNFIIKKPKPKKKTIEEIWGKR